MLKHSVSNLECFVHKLLSSIVYCRRQYYAALYCLLDVKNRSIVDISLVVSMDVTGGIFVSIELREMYKLEQS